MPAASHPKPSPDRNHAPERKASTLHTLRVSGFSIGTVVYVACDHGLYFCIFYIISWNGLGGANPAVNTPRLSRGTRIESCDFIVLIGDP